MEGDSPLNLQGREKGRAASWGNAGNTRLHDYMQLLGI